jgi:hypothetical protein
VHQENNRIYYPREVSALASRNTDVDLIFSDYRELCLTKFLGCEILLAASAALTKIHLLRFMKFNLGGRLISFAVLILEITEKLPKQKSIHNVR